MAIATWPLTGSHEMHNASCACKIIVYEIAYEAAKSHEAKIKLNVGYAH